MFYPDDAIEQVRAASNIVDVIGGYVRLRRSGSSYVGLCPFHNEKSPSFSVSGEKQLYYCFGCGAGGNVFTFLMEYENMSFPEAVAHLAERANIALPERDYSDEEKQARSRRQVLLEIQRLAANYYYHKLQSADGETARKYLDGRVLSMETRRHFGLGYSPKVRDELYRFLKSREYTDEQLQESGLILFDEKAGAHDRFWNRVMFPIMDASGHVVGFGGRVMGDGKPKYLNSPESMIFNKSRTLYGLNFARTGKKPYLILCEGYLDVIAMHQAGFTSAVATLGTAFTAQHALMVRRYTQQVRLAYDSDGAGKKAALRAIGQLRAAGISARVIHMDPYKDPDEFIKAEGGEAFQARIDEAESAFMFEVAMEQEKHQISDPEGRASFIKAVAKMLLIFPEELERKVYIDAVSSAYGIDASGLTRMVNNFGASYTPEQIDEMRRGPLSDETAGRQNSFAEDPLSGQSGSIAGAGANAGSGVQDKIRLSQKLLLTYMIEDVSLFEKYSGIISEEDFSDPLYKKAVSMLFAEYASTGQVTPARIVGCFDNAQEQQEIASLFTTKIVDGDDPKTKEKAISDVIRNIKEDRRRRQLESSPTMEELMKAYKELKKGRN